MISLNMAGKITDLQGNLLTSSQQSVPNWTSAGEGTVDLSFEDGVNHFEFTNYGASSAKARFIEEYRQIYNVVMLDAWADYFFNIWKNKGEASWPNNPYLYTFSEVGSYKNFLQVNSNSRLNASNVLQIYQGDKIDSVHNRQFSENNVSTLYSNSAATFTMSNGNGNINHYWGSYEEWLQAVTRNYTLSFNLPNGEFTPPSTLQEVKDWYASYGYTNIDSIIEILYTRNLANKVYLLFVDGDYVCFACQGKKESDVHWTVEPYNGNTWIYQRNSSDTILYSDAWLYHGTYQNGVFTELENSFSSTIILHDVIYSTDTQIYASDRDHIPDGNYLLTFSARSTTGFTKDSSVHDITFTNGNNTYTLEINSTASQEYYQHGILFTPTSVSCSLKLDLSGIQGSGIELDITKIAVYEIGGD